MICKRNCSCKIAPLSMFLTTSKNNNLDFQVAVCQKKAFILKAKSWTKSPLNKITSATKKMGSNTSGDVKIVCSILSLSVLRKIYVINSLSKYTNCIGQWVHEFRWWMNVAFKAAKLSWVLSWDLASIHNCEFILAPSVLFANGLSTNATFKSMNDLNLNLNHRDSHTKSY